MTSRKDGALRALARFSLVAVASALAASLWAQARPEPGLLLDAQAWQQEATAAAPGAWPADGWYRLVPQGATVEVSAARPGEGTGLVAADAVYVRLPGVTLKTGTRSAYRDPRVLQQPRLGMDYELSLAGTRFSLRVEPAGERLLLVVGYRGQAYTYELGYADAAAGVRAVADFDGDAAPDFLVDVGDATFLLLSTQARPGANLPSAELRNHGC
jgi:hypothetical protein